MRNVVSPIISAQAETESREEVIDKRVEEFGKSESHLVMRRIGVQTLP
ncbi:hypothetical protein GMMP15_2020024 [Candidatus Magnetomoraceae bacterium gMMP-15]